MSIRRSGDISSLWREYGRTRDVDIRNRLVVAYRDMARYAAERVKKGLPRFIELDDLISAGIVGLIKAVEDFEPERGVKFKTYAEIRIRGEILDELRGADWFPKFVRVRIKQFKEVKELINVGDGEFLPTAEDIAEYFGISIEEAEKIEVDGKRETQASFVQLEHMFAHQFDQDSEDDSPSLSFLDYKMSDPGDRILEADSFNGLISCLSERNQIIVIMYFRYEISMRKIGEFFSLCESRISCLISISLKIIKANICRKRESMPSDYLD